MSDPLLKSEIHAERNTGILATGYDSRIQAYITGQGTPFASGYAKNHILRDLNRKLYNYGLSSYITDSYDAGFRSITLTGILAAGGGGGGPLLDVDFPSETYGDVHWAYSMRKLISTYAGDCLRVRRSSDDAELDIGFGADGWIDEAALLAFCAATDGYVVTWYNQSSRGSQSDVTNSTASLQPLIVSSGAIQTATPSGKPSIYFNADELSSSLTGWVAPNDSMRYFALKMRSSPSYHWKKIIQSSVLDIDVHYRSTTNIIRHYYYNAAHDTVESPLLDVWKLIGACKLYGVGNSTSRMLINSSQSTGIVGGADPSRVSIGRRYGNANYPAVMDIPELFCFSGVDHSFVFMEEMEAFIDAAYEIL